MYQGLMLGPVSLVGPIPSAYAVGPTVLAVILLGERLSSRGLIGGAATMAGVAVVAARRRVNTQQEARGRNGIRFGLAAMAGFGISAFVIAAFAGSVG